jgi:hypothetical protein
MAQKRIAKPNDIRWPGSQEALPRVLEDINANFDALFKALEGAGISPSGVISPPGPTGGGGTGTPPGLSDPVTEAHGGTGKTTFSKGDLLVGKADHKLDRRSIGATGDVLTVAAGDAAWVSPVHKALSATHSDSEAADVVRGDLIVGQGATPVWKRLAKGALGYVLRMGASEPAWATFIHNLLSDDHGDVTTAAVVRGDIITGQGATPKWTRLAKGTINQVLKGGTNEPTWGEELDPQFALTKRFGFVDRAETTLAVAAVGDGTYRLTLGSVGATWRYFRNGVLCTITGTKTVLLAGTNPPTEGNHYIYIDSEDGTLVDGSAWTLLDTKVPVAGVLFRGALTPVFWLSDERHTCLIDRRVHYYEHFTEGTRLLAGGTVSGQTVGGTTDAHNTFGIAGAALADEDILLDLTTLVDPNAGESAYVVFYRTAVTTWAWKSSIVPYDYGTYIKYDNAGTQTEGIKERYYNTYLLLTHLDGDARFAIVSGRGTFLTLGAAQAEDVGAFTFLGLTIAEFVIAYRLTWLTGEAFGQAGRARLAATPQAIKIAGITAVVGGASTDHNTLANLQGGDSTERYHVTAAEAGVIAALPAASMALQSSTPGTAQTGHANITGTVVAAKLKATAFPTSDSGLVAGEIWIDTSAGNVLKIVT